MRARLTQFSFKAARDSWPLLTLLLPLLVAGSDPCSHPPPCLVLEKAECRQELVSAPDGSDTWRARYFDSDGSEITCSSDSFVVCEGLRRNVSCPLSWTIKVWFAALKPSPGSLCSATSPAPGPAHCPGHNVQWELSRMCDGFSSCLINTSALSREDGCGGRRFLRMEYTCIGNSEVYSKSQTKFFLMATVGVLSLFALALFALLVTVHFKKRRDMFPLTSLHAPLTEFENPEL